MLILKITVPLVFYNMVISAAGMILPPGMSLLAVTGIGALVSLPFLYVFYRMEQRQRGKVHETDRVFLRSIPYLVLLGAISCIVFNFLINLSPLPKLFPVYEEQFAASLITPPLWVQILCTVIAIPAAEELCFRAHIFAPLRDKCGFWPAALFSSLIFGLYHGNMLQGVYGFCLGLLMAWIFEQCRSVWACWLFHLTANLVSVLASQAAGFDPFSGKTSAALLFIAGCLFLIPVCMIKIRNLFHVN